MSSKARVSAALAAQEEYVASVELEELEVQGRRRRRGRRGLPGLPERH